MNENSKSDWSVKTKAKSIIFLIWFFTSMGGMLYSSEIKNGIGLAIALFGQYFVVFGVLIIIANKNERRFPLVVLIFPLVGIVAFVSGCIILFGGESAKSFLFENAPCIITPFFLILGLFMVIMSGREMRYLNKVCTCSVIAKCVDIDWKYMRRTSNGGIKRKRKVYMPIYSFFFNNKEHTVSNNVYTDLYKYEVGQTYPIFINPNNPYEFIDENNMRGNLVAVLVGVLFMIISTAVMALIFIGNIAS